VDLVALALYRHASLAQVHPVPFQLDDRCAALAGEHGELDHRQEVRRVFFQNLEQARFFILGQFADALLRFGQHQRGPVNRELGAGQGDILAASERVLSKPTSDLQFAVDAGVRQVGATLGDVPAEIFLTDGRHKLASADLTAKLAQLVDRAFAITLMPSTVGPGIICGRVERDGRPLVAAHCDLIL
jgi:hypothetical protein